jgi:hypothetical protein
MRGRRPGSCPALKRCGPRKVDAEKLDSLSRQGVSTTSTTGAGLGQTVRGASIAMSDRIHTGLQPQPAADRIFGTGHARRS